MLSYLRAASAHGVVSTLACCLLCGACSSQEPEETRAAGISGFVGFMLANAFGATDGSEPTEAAKANLRGLGAFPQEDLQEDTQEPVPEESTSCEIAYSGPVTIVTVRSPAALARAIADRGPIPIVYSTEDTTVYEDGRVLTSNVEAVGDHLNALGWAQNSMQVLGSGTGRRASATSYDWSNRSSSTKPATRRKRRRG